MALQFWSDVGVATQSAAATAIAVTGISKASPAVLTHSGADPVVGSYVVLKTSGMKQLHKRVFRVATVVASTSFVLEGVDSTLYETFSSGTFEVLTIDNALSTISDIQVSGADQNYTPTNTIHTSIETQAPTTKTPVVIAMTSQFDPANAALDVLEANSDANEEVGIAITYPTGVIVLAYGYVGFARLPTGSTGAVVETPLSITASGKPTTYAS